MTERDEQAERAAVVREAYTWLRTPYHHRGRIKGVGVDCAQLPAAVYAAAGVIPEQIIDNYPADWHLHRDAERYMERVKEFATEFPGPPKPGDMVIYKMGRCYAHGGIVIEWPIIIHALIRQNVLLTDGLKGQLDGRPHKFFTMWPEKT